MPQLQALLVYTSWQRSDNIPYLRKKMSCDSKKLSLQAAIFINLNVMIGAGIFTNTYALSAKAGALCFLLYPFIGFLMLPLIAVFGQLLTYYPTGGVYDFAKSSGKFLAFLSCWSYFIGKLASCSTMLLVATTFFQQLIPCLASINPVYIALTILFFFTLLNLLNMKVGMIVQSFFLTSKCIPIVFAIISGIWLFDTSHVTAHSFVWTGLAVNIPVVLYCLAGFETACALGRNIVNPSVNGPKAVYYSFGIIMALYGIFQGLIYISTYTALDQVSSYQEIFPFIAHRIFDNQYLADKISFLLSFAIGSSALGGAYGILFANSWNIYILAENNHIFRSSTIVKLNKHQTPWVAVCIEALTCVIFLTFSQGIIPPLQRTAALGLVLAYTISAFAYFRLLQKNGIGGKKWMISCAAIATCMLFIANSIISFVQTGPMPLLLFIGILTSGSCMFYMQKSYKKA